MGMNPPPDHWGKDCTFSVGQLIEWGAVVEAHCITCKGTWPADLHKTLAARGRWFRLIPCRPPCRTKGCAGRLRFFIRCIIVKDPQPGPPQVVSKLTDYQARKAIELRKRLG